MSKDTEEDNVIKIPNQDKSKENSKRILIPTEVIDKLKGEDDNIVFRLIAETPQDKESRPAQRFAEVIPIQTTIKRDTAVKTLPTLPLPLPIPIPGTESKAVHSYVVPQMNAEDVAAQQNKEKELSAFSIAHFNRYKLPTLEDHIADLDAKKASEKDILKEDKDKLKAAKNATMGSFARAAYAYQEKFPLALKVYAVEQTRIVCRAFRNIAEGNYSSSQKIRGAASDMAATGLLKKYKEDSMKLRQLEQLEAKIVPIKQAAVAEEDGNILDRIMLKSAAVILKKKQTETINKHSACLGDALGLVKDGRYLPAKTIDNAVRALDVESEFRDFTLFQENIRMVYENPQERLQELIEDVMFIRGYEKSSPEYSIRKILTHKELLSRGGLVSKDKILHEEEESSLAIKRREEQNNLMERMQSIPQLAGEHRAYLTIFFGKLAENAENDMYRKHNIFGMDKDRFGTELKLSLFKATDKTKEELEPLIPEFCDKIKDTVKMTVYVAVAKYLINMDRHRHRIRRIQSRYVA